MIGSADTLRVLMIRMHDTRCASSADKQRLIHADDKRVNANNGTMPTSVEATEREPTKAKRSGCGRQTQSGCQRQSRRAMRTPPNLEEICDPRTGQRNNEGGVITRVDSHVAINTSLRHSYIF